MEEIKQPSKEVEPPKGEDKIFGDFLKKHAEEFDDLQRFFTLYWRLTSEEVDDLINKRINYEMLCYTVIGCAKLGYPVSKKDLAKKAGSLMKDLLNEYEFPRSEQMATLIEKIYLKTLEYEV